MEKLPSPLPEITVPGKRLKPVTARLSRQIGRPITEITPFGFLAADTTQALPPGCSKSPLGAGFCRLSSIASLSGHPQPSASSDLCRAAEKATCLACRRGGGSTARRGG